MRLELRYVQTFNARGHRYYYFRKPGCARIRLPGLPGSTEFMSAYQAALDAVPRIEIGAGRTVPGTISSLVVAYYGSADFRDLGPATQQYRRWLIEKFRAGFGSHPVGGLEAKHIGAMLTKIAKPPMRKQWLKMLRGLMRYAICIGMRADDPTIGFKIKQRQSDGIPTWGETEIEAFRRHHPLGSRARLAFELLLNTGQRSGDVRRMGRQHVQAGAIQVTQEKTGAKLLIPMHHDLAETIAAMPTVGVKTFLVTPSGKPYTATGFKAWFRQQCDAAGVRHFSAHGLRKAACRRLAEAGCTEKQIAAISGHRSLAEVARYTRAADQAVLARAAMDKVRTSRRV
jgi:integrase